MALALESANLVRQKAYNFIKGTSNSKYSNLWLATLREFFNQHQAKGNADLQFVAFDEADADVDDGTDVSAIDAAHEIYVFYVKKINTATANTVKLFDDATVDTTAGDQALSIPLDQANQEVMLVYPQGFTMTTGQIVTQHTTIEGSTDGSDGADGFTINGA